ncbi:integrin alpha-8-like [Macrobrachium rosenbergii]|uniref:integrin alpha-8-like n=1 Tax=Macrobrachium rosenbergii TaxID=79674 RepID=UPI0034D79FB1
MEDLVVRCSLLFLIMQAGKHFAGSFNVDKSHYQVVSGQNGSYFGFSVALWADLNGTHSLAVGAPRGNLADSANHTFPFGNLYLCRPLQNNKEEPCVVRKDIPFFNETDKSEQAILWDEDTYMRHGIGLGETVFAPDKNESKLVVCAPRYPRKNSAPNSPEVQLQPRGACFAIYRASHDQPEKIMPYPNYNLKNDQSKEVQPINDYEGTGFAEMGFSAFLDDDGQSLYLGGPSAFYFEGVAVKMGISFPRWKRLKSSQVKRKKSGMGNIYNGWATVVGKLCSRGKKCVAVSSPGYDDHKGKVTIYAQDLKSSKKVELQGEKGIGYGLCLGIGDFNGDGQDDLAVGAPYAEKKGAAYLQDTGKVFIYFAPSENATNYIVLEGQLPWGRFGHSVTSPGDLDSDGYADLAIGAPFTNDGRGSVYIYNGAEEGIRSTPSQVIHASEFQPHRSLLWFGYSIDGGLDFDGNGYPDLVVGAPGSNQAVFLRTGPVISLQGQIEFQTPEVYLNDASCPVVLPDGILQNVVCFNLTIHLQYQAKHISEPIPLRLRVELDHYKRLAFVDNHDDVYSSTQKISHVDANPVPLNLLVYVKPNIRHLWLSEVAEAEMKVSLLQKQHSTSDLFNVMSAYSKTKFSNSTTFYCPPPQNCLTRSDLVLLPEEDPRQLVVSDGLMNVAIAFEVRNNTAYSVTLTVTVPDALEYLQVQSDHHFPKLRNYNHEGKEVMLDFIFPSQIPKGLKITLTFTFKHSAIRLVEYDQPNLSFGFVIKGDTMDLDNSNNAHIVEVPLISRVELNARGWSIPDLVEAKLNETMPGRVLLDFESYQANMSDTKADYLGPKITHHFIVVNRGPSPLIRGQIVLGLPLQLALGKPGQLRHFPILYVVDPVKTTGNLRCSSLPLNPLNLTTDYNFENETEQDDIDPSTSSPVDFLELNESSTKSLQEEEEEEEEEEGGGGGGGEGGDGTLHTANYARRRRSVSVVDQLPRLGEEPAPYLSAERIILENSEPQVTTPASKNPQSGGGGARKKPPTKLSCDVFKCEEIICDVSDVVSDGNVTIEVTGYIVAGTLELIHLHRVIIETGMAFYTSQQNVFLNNHIASNKGSFSEAYSRFDTHKENNDVHGRNGDAEYLGKFQNDEGEETSTEKGDANLPVSPYLSMSEEPHGKVKIDENSSEVVNYIPPTERQERTTEQGESTSSHASDAEFINPDLLSPNSSDSFSGKSREGRNDTAERYVATTGMTTASVDSQLKDVDLSTGMSVKMTESTGLASDQFSLDSHVTSPQHLETSDAESSVTTEGMFTSDAESSVTSEGMFTSDAKSSMTTEGMFTSDAESSVTSEGMFTSDAKSSVTTEGMFTSDAESSVTTEGMFTSDAKSSVTTEGMFTSDAKSSVTIEGMYSEYTATSKEAYTSTASISDTDLVRTEKSELPTAMSEKVWNSTVDTNDTYVSRDNTFNSYPFAEALKEATSTADYEFVSPPGSNYSRSENQTTTPKNRTKSAAYSARRYDVRVSTYITIIKKTKTSDFSVESVLQLRGLEIIGAVVGGLMAVVILCSLLHMCGFFKRKRISKEQREELEMTLKERQEKEKYG